MKNIMILSITTMILVLSISLMPIDNSNGSSSNRYERLIRSVIKEYEDIKVAILKAKGAYDLTSDSSKLKKENILENVVMYSYYIIVLNFLYKDIKAFYNHLDELYEQKNGIPKFEYRNFVAQVFLKYGIPCAIFLKLQNYPPEFYDIITLYVPVLIATRFVTPSLYWAFEETMKSTLSLFLNGIKSVGDLLWCEEKSMKECITGK